MIKSMRDAIYFDSTQSYGPQGERDSSTGDVFRTFVNSLESSCTMRANDTTF